MLFLEVSAKNGRNVEETFLSLTKEIKNSKAANAAVEESENLKIKVDGEGKAKKCAC